MGAKARRVGQKIRGVHFAIELAVLGVLSIASPASLDAHGS